MAITKQLRDEADRTIAGITSYYEQYGDSLIDAEEREHRISKVVASLEGCNGLTDKEKIQKTAENLFGLTCAWERDSLALKRELMLNRETTEKSFKKSQTETAAEFEKLGADMKSMSGKIDKLSTELQKLLTTASQKPCSSDYLPQDVNSPQPNVIKSSTPWYYRMINVVDRHFGTAVLFVIIFFLLVILSGNLDWISSFFTK